MLTRLQKSCDMTQVSADYNALFIGDECAVPPYRSAAREFTHFNALLVNTERYTPFPLKIQDKQNIAADQLTNSGKSQSSRCFMHHFRRCVSSLLR